MKQKNNMKLLASILALLITTSSPVNAADSVVDIIPQTTQAATESSQTIDVETHPALHITPDKSELIRLDADASSIIVGNPVHVNVIADSSRTLVAVPRVPGATYFTVLDKNGNVIMQRHVIVASPKENYVRIKRTCMEDSDGCANASVYYCPDMCHEISLGIQEQGGSNAEASSAEDGGNNNGNQPPNPATDVNVDDSE